jgi:hypothetical protein
VIPLREFDLTSQELLHGTWSEVKGIDAADTYDDVWRVVTKADGIRVMGNLDALVAVRPKQQRKRTAEEVVLAELSFAARDDKEPTADDLGHGRASDIVAALRKAGMLREESD